MIHSIPSLLSLVLTPSSLRRDRSSEVTTVDEGALAHARPVVAEGEVVVGLSPAHRLSRRDHGRLLSLLFITNLALVLSFGLVLELAAELEAFLVFLVALVHHVVAVRLVLFFGLMDDLLRHDVVLAEVVQVAVLRLELLLKLLNFLLGR